MKKIRIVLCFAMGALAVSAFGRNIDCGYYLDKAAEFFADGWYEAGWSVLTFLANNSSCL